MKALLKSVLLASTLSLAANASAAVLDIDFNGNQFLLGAFESAETGTQFYNYGSPFGSSANPVYPGTATPLPLEADALQVFAHVNTNTNELSFGIILEKPDGSGGGTFATTVTFSTPATLAFVDDPGESGPLNSAGPVNISLQWIDCCTDGFVISGFNPTDMFLDLANVTGSDLTEVIFFSPDGNDTRFSFPQDVFNISITSCDPQTDPNGCVITAVPEPSNIALVGLGLLGLGVGRLRLKREREVV